MTHVVVPRQFVRLDANYVKKITDYGKIIAFPDVPCYTAFRTEWTFPGAPIRK